MGNEKIYINDLLPLLAVYPAQDYAVSDPRTYPSSSWTSVTLPGNPASGIDPYPLNYIWLSGDGMDRVYRYLNTPVLNTISIDENTFTIDFTDTNSYAGYADPVYAVYANDLFKGFASSTSLGGSSRSMTLGGWLRDKPYEISIAAMRYKNVEDPDVDYSQSKFSDPILATGEWVIPAQDYWNELNNIDVTYLGGRYIKVKDLPIDVLNLPKNIFNRVNIAATSPYTSTFSAEVLTGLYVDENFAVAPFDANSKIKLRVINGSWDYLFRGATDYMVKDTDVKAGNPYTVLVNIDAKKIDQIYDDNTTEGPFMRDDLKDVIETKIREHYLKSRPYIEDSLKRTINTNFTNTAFQSRTLARELIDQSMKGDDLGSVYTTKQFPFKGNIYLSAKMMLPSNTGDFFSYVVYDSGNGNIVHQGRNAGVIVFSDPQDPAYSVTILDQYSDTADVLGE